MSLTADQVKEHRVSKQSQWDNYSEPGMDFGTGFSRQFSNDGSKNPVYMSEEQFPMSDLSPVEPEQTNLSMFEGVLSRNLGLDVVVVITKSDSMSTLESEHGLTDQHFDFIQQSVRKFCLTYGASLFFTSVNARE